MTLVPTPQQKEQQRRTWEYFADRLGRLGQGTWTPVDRWGSMGSFDDPDPDIAKMRADWREGASPDLFDFNGGLKLEDGVGRGQPNNRADVARVELALNRHGFYDLESTGGPTGYYGPPQGEALLAFQKARGLTADGWAAKNGETAVAMSSEPGKADGLSAADDRIQLAKLDQRYLLPNKENLFGFGAGNGGGGGGRISVPRPAPPKPPPTRQLAVPPSLLDYELSPAPPDSKDKQASPYVRHPWDSDRSPMLPREIQPPSETKEEREKNTAGEIGNVADYITRGIPEEMWNRFGPRGDKTTQRGNDIVAEQCKKVIQDEFMANLIAKHEAGAHQDGTGRYLKERVVQQKGVEGLKGSVRPDLMWTITHPDGSTENVYLNTADTLKSGQFTDREKTALEKLRRYVEGDIADAMPKLRPGMDEEEFTKQARQKCREIFKKYLRVTPIS